MVIELVTEEINQYISNIPEDFDKLFGISNLEIETNDGRVLYANQELLSYVSYYFKDLFPPKSKQVTKFRKIQLDIDFSTMKEILRHVYNIERQYVNYVNPFSNISFEKMVSIGKAAKKLDFPVIWQQIYEALMERPPSVGKLQTAVDLELYAEKSLILRQLSVDEIKECFQKETEQMAFSFFDMHVIMNTIDGSSTNYPLPHPKYVAKELPKCGSDGWINPDDGICGAPIFAICSIFSPDFQNIFKTAKEQRIPTKIDVSASTLWTILEILTDRRVTIPDLKMLSDVYKAAVQYDFPCIRELCRQNFIDLDIDKSLEVAYRLNLKNEKKAILAKMDGNSLKLWAEKRKNYHFPFMTYEDVMEMAKKCI